MLRRKCASAFMRNKKGRQERCIGRTENFVVEVSKMEKVRDMKREETLTGKFLEKDFPELLRLRHWLHQHPECAMEEVETSRFIGDYLRKLGISCRELVPSGVIGQMMVDETLPWLAIRAEIDGLPVPEKTGLPFASFYEGKMHACGHDAITAVVLCLAKVLSEQKEKMKYNLRFLFEPAEETGEGAKHMIRHGALGEPRPEGILVFHFGNQEPRAMEIQKSISTAVIGGLKITVHGKSSHWSQMGEGVDALYAASRLVVAIREINERLTTEHPFVLGFGMLQSGKGGNIVADEAQMTGSLRAFTEKDFQCVLKKLKQYMDEIHGETGADIQMEMTKKIPPIINHPSLVEKGTVIGRKIFCDQFYLGTKPFLVGDNAAYYMEQVPGIRAVFLAGREMGENYPIHNPRFDIEEPVMLDALEFLYRFCTSE